MANITGMALRVYIQTDDGKEHERVFITNPIADEDFTIGIKRGYLEAVTAFMVEALPGALLKIAKDLETPANACGCGGGYSPDAEKVDRLKTDVHSLIELLNNVESEAVKH